MAHKLFGVPAVRNTPRRYAKIDVLRRRPDYLTEWNGVIATFSINFTGTVFLRRSRHLVSALLFSAGIYRSVVNPRVHSKFYAISNFKHVRP